MYLGKFKVYDGYNYYVSQYLIQLKNDYKVLNAFIEIILQKSEKNIKKMKLGLKDVF